MSDDDSGPIVSGEVAPAPSETPRTPTPEAPDEKSHDQRIKEMFRDGLGLMAHGTEDATDYIRERETQDKFLDGEDLSSSQVAAWHQRAQVALQRALDASARARGEVPPSQQQAPAESPNYVAADAPDYDAHMGSAQERVNVYFNSRTDIPDVQAYKDSITKVVTENDPRSELSGYFLAASNPGAMIEALAYEPDAIRYLVSLPQAKRAQEMAKLEGYLHAQQMLAQQNASYEPQPRRHTAAPPPINPPRGGANPPSDIRSLSGKDDVGDYVKARMQQERRYKEKWE